MPTRPELPTDLDATTTEPPGSSTPPVTPFAFDDPPRQRRRRRGVVALAAVAVVVLGSGAVLGVQASSADPLAELRTAVVGTRSVAQTIDAVATVEPVSQATVTFPVSGTVATVAVATGDTVTAGQPLAILDTTSLQATIDERQADLAKAQLALQQALTGQATTGSATGGTGSAAGNTTAGDTAAGDTAAAPSSGSTGSTGDTAASSSASTSSSSSATAYELVTYQKAVDAAGVDLVVARQALGQATIVSPLAGTVVALDLAVGDEVTAGSATAAVVVAGAGGFELATTVSVDDLPDVAVGQAVVVRPDAQDDELAGTVVAIGAAPFASSTTDYAVTIAISGDSTGLRNGSTASVSIVTDDEVEAVAVPASAVTTDGDRRTVVVVDASGQTTDVTVEVGAVGGAWIAVTSGVDVGQTVVLADLDEPLPGSATDGSSATTSGAGGTGGPPAGAFAGGPPAGMRPGG